MSEQAPEQPAEAPAAPIIPGPENPDVQQEPTNPEAPPAPGTENDPPLSDPGGAAQESAPIEPAAPEQA